MILTCFDSCCRWVDTNDSPKAKKPWQGLVLDVKFNMYDSCTKYSKNIQKKSTRGSRQSTQLDPPLFISCWFCWNDDGGYKDHKAIVESLDEVAIHFMSSRNVTPVTWFLQTPMQQCFSADLETQNHGFLLLPDAKQSCTLVGWLQGWKCKERESLRHTVSVWYLRIARGFLCL